MLAGWAVPVSESIEAIEAGIRALDAGGSGTARARVTSTELDPSLIEELVSRTVSLGRRLVVRSSAVAESQALWAGAFASYAELAPSEVPRGVKGCWASVFTPDALRRGEAAGVGPADLGMGVLIQPEIRPEFGGVAVAGVGGTVTIAAIEGPPAAIVAGWERGEVLTFESGRPVPSSDLIGPERVAAVADLARNVADLLGYDHIEWAESGGRLWLLQAQSAPPRVQAPPSDRAARRLPNEPRLDGLARLLANYPGEVGHQLVLDWAVGEAFLPPPARGPEDLDPPRLLARCRELRDDLVAARWPELDESPLGSLIREPDRTAWDGLLSGPAPDPSRAAELLGLLEALGQRLAREGRIPAPSWVGLLRMGELEDLTAGGVLDPRRRFGIGKWEPLLFQVVTARGFMAQGEAAVPGWGAGRLRVIRDEKDAEQFTPREVVAARYPLGNLAPLLWDAAGLITVGGSPGAHLFEVASWLGVPSVCGIDLEGAAGRTLAQLRSQSGFLAAVDGDSGGLALLRG